MNFEWFISRRYLRVKRKQTFISFITIISVSGVAVGVAASIVVIAVMTGFGADLKEKILSLTPHLQVMSHLGSISDDPDLLRKIEEVPGVVAATPFIDAQALMKSSNGVTGAVVRGVEKESICRVIELEKTLVKGTLDGLAPGNKISNAPPPIVIGKELARDLGVDIDDTVYLITPKGPLTPMGQIPGMKKFLISGIFESGFYEYDASFAYIPLKEAQKMLHLQERIGRIQVRVKDVYHAGMVGDEIEETLGSEYWSRDWISSNKNLFTALRLEKIAMMIVLTLIVLVAAFNIVSTLIMMVMEKTKDIAILKSMGATDQSIKKIFVYQGLLIGCVGTFLGVCAGPIICWLLSQIPFFRLAGDVYYISTPSLPFRIESFDVAIISSGAILISFLATLYPAKQAAKLDPVQALRYE
ncbi:MAG: lipoprotein-releasing ABC transporter permease subunit [Pseudomonadota bacterium]